MIDRAAIKETAKARLGGKIFSTPWMNALLVCLITGMIMSVPSGLSSLPSLLSNARMLANGDFENAYSGISTVHFGFSFLGIVSFVLAGPISYGISKLFLRSARTGEQMDIAGAFDGFREDFGGNFLLCLMMGIFIFLWTLLFIIPGIVMGYAYSFAFYIKADHPDYGWKQCLDESRRITNGYKGDLFMLDLSFIGWYFVGALACGVGTLWVQPYAEMAKTLYYLELSARANAAAGGYPPPYGAPQQPYQAAPQYPPQQTPYQAAPQQPYQPAQPQASYQPPYQAPQAPQQPYAPPQQTPPQPQYPQQGQYYPPNNDPGNGGF